MSAERRFRLRGNTVKPVEPPKVKAVFKPVVTINVAGDMVGSLDAARELAQQLNVSVGMSRRLASNAPLPESVSMSVADLEQTYGMPRRREFQYSGAPMRYRSYDEIRYPDVLAMQDMLFRRSRAVDYLLSINHENWTERPITCPEDAFLVLCALLAYCDQDTDEKRLRMSNWVRGSIHYTPQSSGRYGPMLAALSSYGRTATLGSLPDVFFQTVRPAR